MNRKECQKIEKDNVSAERRQASFLWFFAYRLHNEMLDKKINSTHDCQDYIKVFNFWESKLKEISPFPRTALACSTSKGAWQ